MGWDHAGCPTPSRPKVTVPCLEVKASVLDGMVPSWCPSTHKLLPPPTRDNNMGLPFHPRGLRPCSSSSAKSSHHDPSGCHHGLPFQDPLHCLAFRKGSLSCQTKTKCASSGCAWMGGRRTHPFPALPASSLASEFRYKAYPPVPSRLSCSFRPASKHKTFSSLHLCFISFPDSLPCFRPPFLSGCSIPSCLLARHLPPALALSRSKKKSPSTYLPYPHRSSTV